MNIENEYAVKLFFPRSNFLQIYFEAVANAFDANADWIKIHIKSDGQIAPSFLEIDISDNGEGFTHERFLRFSQLKEPSDPFHKGLGRLVYLQYFSTVEIDSCFGEKKRNFIFSKDFEGDSDISGCPEKTAKGSKLKFRNFLNERFKAYSDLKPMNIKSEIIAQLLPLLIEMDKHEKDFQIEIELTIRGKSEQKKLVPDLVTITSDDIPKFRQKTIEDIGVYPVQKIPVVIYYKITSGLGEKTQLIAINVDGRTIPIDLLPKHFLPDNHSAIFLFESEIFSGATDSSRLQLNLPESVSKRKFQRNLRREVSTILNKEIPLIGERNTSVKKSFEEQYPHLEGYFENNTVGLIDKEEALSIAQNSFFAEQRKILESEQLSDELFEKSLELSSRTLAEYILYREKIIKNLGEKVKEGKEKEIHDLIVPRYSHYEGNELANSVFSNNAWLLDDKFMSFRTILSEAQMTDVISAITLEVEIREEIGRPDISMIFSSDPEGSEKVDVVVIEIKRKDVDIKNNIHAATQLAQRANKIVQYCPNINRMWYFAIIDIDEEMARTLRTMTWTPLYSKGSIFYKEFVAEGPNGITVPAPTCLVSYDAIIKDAAARNHTFLEILKSEIKKVTEKSRIVIENTSGDDSDANVDGEQERAETVQ